MKRQIPGLHGATAVGTFLEGLFIVRVEQAQYNWHRQSPFFLIRFAVLEPKEYSTRPITGRIYCTPKALWRLNWFLRDFGYDTDLLGRDEVDEKALVGLTGVIRTSRRLAAVFSTLMGLPQQLSGRGCQWSAVRGPTDRTTALMTYSFTQISPGHPFGWLCDPETLARGVGYRPIQLTSQGQHGPAVKAGLSVARSCPKISMAPVLAIVWMVAGVPLQRRTARPRWEECGSFATRAGSR